MSPKQQAFSLLLFFLHQAYYLLALFSARDHSEACSKLGDGVLEVTRHLLEFFFSKSSWLWSVGVHIFSVAPKTTRTTLKKINHFVTSFLLQKMSFNLSDRLSTKGTRKCFGTLLSTRKFEMAVVT